MLSDPAGMWETPGPAANTRLSKSLCSSNLLPVLECLPLPLSLPVLPAQHQLAGISQEATKDAGDNNGAISMGPGTRPS